MLWLGWWGLRKALLRATVAALCCGVVVLPWIVRNYFAVRSVSVIRDNYGLELSVSNNDLASPLMADNLRRGLSHPFGNRAQAGQMKAMGERAYYAMRFDSAKCWIFQHPSRFLLLTSMRVREFWFTTTNSWPKSAFYGVLVLLGGVGLVIFCLSGCRDALLLAVLWIVFPIPFYLVQIDPRYRYPIDWSIWLLAAFAAHSLAGRLLNRKRSMVDNRQCKSVS
jgi:hypothetical protein